MREGLRAGISGGGWDNVSWIGEWDIDLSAVRCPVLLWYGSDDRFAQPAHRVWLSEHLPRVRLVVHDGEGHLGIFEHLGEMLDALTEPDTQDPASTGEPSSAVPATPSLTPITQARGLPSHVLRPATDSLSGAHS